MHYAFCYQGGNAVKTCTAILQVNGACVAASVAQLANAVFGLLGC